MPVSLKAKQVTSQSQCQAEPGLDLPHSPSPAQGTFHSPTLCFVNSYYSKALLKGNKKNKLTAESFLSAREDE